jgi:site-specific DNA-methyltransferase (adenine-specific)
VEKWDGIDTTQTTQSLLKLFGSANLVITNYIREIEKSAPKRFLYTPKASKSERNAGLEGMEEKLNSKMFRTANNTSNIQSKGFERFGTKPAQNNHPTVKPIKLMEYLVRLVTPKNGICLDPFMGSGTTAVACINTNRRFIGIELEPEYVEIANKRIQEELSQTKLQEGGNSP